MADPAIERPDNAEHVPVSNRTVVLERLEYQALPDLQTFGFENGVTVTLKSYVWLLLGKPDRITASIQPGNTL